MHRVGGGDVTSQAQLRQQLLHREDFVGFFLDFDVREHQSGIDGECAEQLLGLGVGETVEAALQRLAVERDDARVRALGPAIEVGGVFAEDLFDLLGAESVQDIADGRMSGRPFPMDAESFVQLFPMDPEVSSQPAIRIGAADNRENRKQQHVR